MRVEVFFRDAALDGRSHRFLKDLQSALGSQFLEARVADVYLLSNIPGLTPALASEVFADPVAQKASFDRGDTLEKTLGGWTVALEVAYKSGVTNPMAITAREALENTLERELGSEIQVQTGSLYLVKTSETLDESQKERLIKYLHNPLIQQCILLEKEAYDLGQRLPELYPLLKEYQSPGVQEVPIRKLSAAELNQLSKDRLLALTEEEMKAIQTYYNLSETTANRKGAGLPAEPTDVELEMLAQTWSEHCKHKIFAADVEYEDTVTGKSEKISSLYSSYIKQTTKDLTPTRPFLRSVFSDNAGVVAFDEETLVCFKVETHNSPSALDPYGGAITGIVGVNRDILGTGKGSQPIFNTNYLCFGDPDTPAEDLPKGLLHPRTVMKGVHQGIIDGGNHSGIPTSAGGFLFDESYMGKPLVFCGTGGIMPAKVRGEDSWVKHIDAGDLAVMVGGRIGKDGIHGATFSSLALDETSPTSAVQIGDPIIQRKMTDFLIEARDLGLYKGITDNGAGGLSSSLGEMAESSGGIRIDLDKCPLKYPGLAPWEILVSESQERMSLSLEPSQWDAFHALAKKRAVEATVVGEFTRDQKITATFGGKTVGQVTLAFLHGGAPKLKIPAQWIPPVRQNHPIPQDLNLEQTILTLLADPTIASKENLVRQYDHEVQGRSVIKPFTGIKCDGPSEGAVLRLKPSTEKGLTVTHGICPRFGDIDTYNMAQCAVDEAYRAHIALGGNPEEASILDNFCWPDPVLSEKTPDGPYKMAQLVRTCKGLRDAALDYGLPLISGKDSMKNDAVMNGKKVSIRPTLLISLMGAIKSIKKAMTTEFRQPGDKIYLLGTTRNALGGSSLEKMLKTHLEGVPEVKTSESLPLYKALASAIESGILQSVHDLANGGLAIALAESALGGRLGGDIDLAHGVKAAGITDEVMLFSESPSRFVVSVTKELVSQFEKAFKGLPLVLLGTVSTGSLKITTSTTTINLTQEQLLHSWNTLNRKAING